MNDQRLQAVPQLRLAGVAIALAAVALIGACNERFVRTAIGSEEPDVVEESFSGTISSIGDNQFVISDASNMQHTLMVNDDTQYTVDGKEASFDDLIEDCSADVTAEKTGDSYVAKTVDATIEDSPE